MGELIFLTELRQEISDFIKKLPKLEMGHNFIKQEGHDGPIMLT